ncbi:ABC transporter substrate-binding protein [Wenjunlia tyrosinilytica]|uniref:ABC transporter substrate-binding protein n=1 Tax=Wenjunlia tyrosinilytica TaxID=1544741 RepID=A0A918E1F8_9ACTN|nr:ABC transporter substrate-binding protein [Wenjunlia tyrosinilytica]GGO96171.1 ABC transporter substrate-binding protein [Wenjunlia tyrosinilytica]
MPHTTYSSSASVTQAISRRRLLQGVLAAGAATGLAPVLSACGSSDSGSSTKSVSLGSNFSDAVPKKALQGIMDSFEKESGLSVKINTVAHNSFQEQINNYLQGKPQDVFTWFAGFRMQFFAERGLVGDISDVWTKIGGNYSDAMKKASTGKDGKQYFVPLYNYPWAVFYRKSVFEAHGYQAPKTLDEFKSLGNRMKKDGLTPIAFADKDGWPAMGTFDYLNMRTNGYDFHVSLMAGKESWTDPKVKKVFETWRELLPLHQTGSLSRTWQEAAQSLAQKKSGMYVIGSFVSQQFTGKDAEDVDFFPFPEVDSTVGTGAVEAPIDGFMLSKKPKNPEGAKKLLEYFAKASTQEAYLKSDPNNVAASKAADTSGYNPLQKKCADLISGAENISQFLDRDTRPDFASTVMIPSLQTFIRNPKDIDGLLGNIEKQKKSIFTS